MSWNDRASAPARGRRPFRERPSLDALVTKKVVASGPCAPNTQAPALKISKTAFGRRDGASRDTRARCRDLIYNSPFTQAVQ